MATLAPFISKTDWFGLSDTSLVCISDSDGKSSQTAEAQGQDGSVVAYNVYGETVSPSNEYRIKGDISKADGDIKLGAINVVDTLNICLNNISINTSAGSAPTFSASGEQVEVNSANNCEYSIPAFSLSKKHHAQILFNAFTFTGDVHLQSAKYSITAEISKAEKDGDCLAHDVVNGKITVDITFIQTGPTEPVITAGTGWAITSALACENPDSDWPTWSATLTKYLAKDVAQTQTAGTEGE